VLKFASIAYQKTDPISSVFRHCAHRCTDGLRQMIFILQCQLTLHRTHSRAPMFVFYNETISFASTKIFKT